jgi:hypothetical protein
MPPPTFLHQCFFFSFIIHMCIQGLGHFLLFSLNGFPTFLCPLFRDLNNPLCKPCLPLSSHSTDDWLLEKASQGQRNNEWSFLGWSWDSFFPTFRMYGKVVQKLVSMMGHGVWLCL